MSTTRGLMYFVGVTSLEKLEIQFVPANIRTTRQGDVQAVEIVGKNNPNYQYTSGETLVRMDLSFHAEDQNREDVITKCRWLEALVYNEGLEDPPERVKLVWGDLYRDEVFTVKSVDYKLSQFNREAGALPCQATVNIVLALDPVENRRRSDLR